MNQVKCTQSCIRRQSHIPHQPFFPLPGLKPNGLVMNDQIREELSEAASMTSQAYSNIRAGNTGSVWVCVFTCLYLPCCDYRIWAVLIGCISESWLLKISFKLFIFFRWDDLSWVWSSSGQYIYSGKMQCAALMNAPNFTFLTLIVGVTAIFQSVETAPFRREKPIRSVSGLSILPFVSLSSIYTAWPWTFYLF